MQIRPFLFWTHLALGLATGLIAVVMAGTAVIMAFADTYLDLREYSLRRVAVPAGAAAHSLESMAARVSAAHPGEPVNRIGIDRRPNHAIEFYHGTNGLVYVDPYSDALRESDSVPLRRSLHKGVEQWHRFLGLTGANRAKGKLAASWFNVALIPLLLSGVILWWPRRWRWTSVRAAISPVGAGPQGRGTFRSWHTALGFWTAPLLLIMVITATEHSFPWMRKIASRLTGASTTGPGSGDSLWAPTMSARAVPAGSLRLTLDELRTIGDHKLPGWTRLDLHPAPSPNPEGRYHPVRLVAMAPGWGPSFFPVVLQVDPHSGETLDLHSWADLGPGTRMAAWSRWLHKGEAFGRTGQIIAGLACLVMVFLIATGWLLALRRLMPRRADRHS